MGVEAKSGQVNFKTRIQPRLEHLPQHDRENVVRYDISSALL